MDDADNAQQYIDREREASIARARTAAMEPPLIMEGLHVCVGCYEVLSIERLDAMPQAVRCVACQANKERGVQ